MGKKGDTSVSPKAGVQRDQMKESSKVTFNDPLLPIYRFVVANPQGIGPIPYGSAGASVAPILLKRIDARSPIGDRRSIPYR